MRRLAFTVSFLLAFLLFAVEPMATKMVLPTLGGTPAVWNTVMFTFQLLLLGGYLYAHAITRHLTARVQIALHALLILVSCLFLPLAVKLTTSDLLVEQPIRALVIAFITQLGLPFFCVAATAPLLQAWVSRSNHPLAKTPYVLYSASNLGSFAGLLGYVGIVEPLLDLHQQSVGWSVLYVFGTLALLATGLRLKPGAAATAATEGVAPTWRMRLTWLWLAFLPSSLSLGVTTYIATDVASVPLLWVIPLSLYLLSFVDAFRTRPRLVPLCQRLGPLLGLAALALYGAGSSGFFSYVFQLVIFAVLALAIHGWLARRQPPAQYLTQFYVCLSIGGALGGVLNGLVAPMVFHSALEYPIVLLLTALTGFILLQRREEAGISVARHLRTALEVLILIGVMTAFGYAGYLQFHPAVHAKIVNPVALMIAASTSGLLALVVYRRYVRAFYACASVITIMLLVMDHGVAGYETLFKDRNFFGVSRIYENPNTNARYLMHDTTLHGLQSLDPKKAMVPMAYYGSLKEMFRALPLSHTKPLGIIGLGTGTLKCFAVAHQPVDFFEINPMSKAIAEDTRYFTYLSDCPGDSRIYLGDGRIRLAEQPDGRYGVFVIDAFSSDAIPSHLLTKEAMAMYLRKLAPGGVLIIHTTNRHIELWPLIAAQMRAVGAVGYGKFSEAPADNKLLFSSYWVAIARNAHDLAPLVGHDTSWQPLKDEGDRPWTDQYINLLPYFKAFR